MAGRFASLSNAEIDQIEQAKDSSNTKKVVAKSVKLLRSYLTEKGISPLFENLSNTELDSTLKEFYANARTEKGELYKVTSFKQIKYGLSKYLKTTSNVDINGPGFSKSNDTFKALQVDLTRKGKGGVEHKPPISGGDIQRLYGHPHAFSIEKPCGLQNKVMLELMYYTCRRGRENVHKMTKSTFVLEKVDQGREYV